jgi:DNA-binding transcriptional LysR family regulator
MNLDAIKTFLTVVETGNLNTAADQLNVTQSTVTARLDVLEERLQEKLLMRSRRGSKLTKAGFKFLRHAELIQQSWDQGRKAISLPKQYSDTFSLACLSGLWDGIGSNWLVVLRENFPDLATEAWPGTAIELTHWLDSGLIDAALSTEPIAGRQIHSSILMQDEYVQVATHPRETVEWDPEYIYVDLGPNFRRQHAAHWTKDQGARMTFGDSRWALQTLLNEGGSAYLPKRLIQTYLSSKKLHIVDSSPSFTQDIYISWREANLNNFPWLSQTNEWMRQT